ncbi:hypothetical protein, partial [Nitrosomonas eutropha]|uniref:hypothetical protein n=1 Tax=Nitrosomonas eutropha TaxID=916 RepID=UPI0021ACC6C2
LGKLLSADVTGVFWSLHLFIIRGEKQIVNRLLTCTTLFAILSMTCVAAAFPSVVAIFIYPPRFLAACVSQKPAMLLFAYPALHQQDKYPF